MLDRWCRLDKSELTNKKDYIRSNYHQVSFGEALRVLKYPSLQSVCIRCCKIINSPSIACISCHKHYHYQCSLQVNTLNLLLYSKSYTCQSCLNKDKCFNCHLRINQEKEEILTCKCCAVVIHKNCHNISCQQLIYLNQVTSSKHHHIQSSLLKNQIVCSQCLHYYGINTIVAEQTFQFMHFRLVQLDHPHPCIIIWIKTHDMNMKNINNSYKYQRAKYLFPIVETEELLSIYIPPECQSLKINQVHRILMTIFEPKSFEYKKSKEILKKIFVLIKKKYIFDSLFWQQPSQTNISKVIFSRFFHLINIHSCLSSYDRNQISGQLLFCLNDYIIREKVLNKCQTIGIVDIYLAKYEQNNTNNQQVSLSTIYKIYLKNGKQYLNISNLSQKVFLLTSLLNTIYFIDKTIRPIAIFTNQQNIAWWKHKLRKYSSLLNILSLDGPPQYLRYIMNCFFYRGNDNFQNFNFNVLLIPYENMSYLDSIGLVKQRFYHFSLLIMDEKMSVQAYKIYSNVKIARIKLSNKINTKIKTNFLNIHQNESNSFLQLSLSPINETTKYLCQQFQQRYSSSKSKSNILLKQFHRINILNYIMNYGVSDPQSTKRAISKQQPQCFIQGNNPIRQISTQSISEYMCYFMAHLNVFSQVNNIEQSSFANTINFFFFQYAPILIKKRILDLKRMKNLCKRFPNEPFILNDMQKYFSEATSQYFGGEAWSPPIFDYFLCRTILQVGFGKWKQLIAFQQDWDGNGKISTLKDHLTGKIMLQIHNQESLQKFIKNRVLQILQFLDKIRI